MKLFTIYSNQFAVGNKPIGLASLAAVLKNAGHEFQLFDCTQYILVQDHTAPQDSNAMGLKTLEFKEARNFERLPSRKKIIFNTLVETIIAEIDAFKPDIIGLSALTDDYPLGLTLMRRVKQAFPSIPTIAGGVHATVDPEGVIAERCFDMVCVGEGEYVVLDIAERIDNKNGFNNIPNIWLKNEDGSIEKNRVRPYEQNLDLFPFPDWTIYPATAFYKPFLGYVYKYGDFEMSRGCPYKCSYCINVQLHEIYKFTNASYHREKSIPRVIEEIRNAVDKYDIEFLKFWDETFLLMSPERMEEFRDLYADLKIPYVIETTGQSITEFSAQILHDTNCKSVSIGMETGNSDIRNGLLSKPVDNLVYVTAYNLLEQKGIQKVSFNMIGLPNESKEDIFRTIGLNRLLRTDTQSVGVFYPYKGSPIRDMMVRDGLISDDFDLSNLIDYNFTTFTSGNRSVVHFKDMDSKEVNNLRVLFSSYCFWPIQLFPLIDYVRKNQNPFVTSLFNGIQNVTYHKKYGDWPSHIVKLNEDHLLNKDIVSMIESFEDSEVKEFAELLIVQWSEDGLDKLVGFLKAIALSAIKLLCFHK